MKAATVWFLIVASIVTCVISFNLTKASRESAAYELSRSEQYQREGRFSADAGTLIVKHARAKYYQKLFSAYYLGGLAVVGIALQLWPRTRAVDH